jgi:hypothetical protein
VVRVVLRIMGDLVAETVGQIVLGIVQIGVKALVQALMQ